MVEPVLYGKSPSTYTRTARLAFAEKGVPYRLADIAIEFSPQGPRFPADYARDLHPFARMPALRHGDVKLFESFAIARYVDEAFPGPALQPADPLGRARMTQWVSAICDYVAREAAIPLIGQRLIGPRFMGRPADEAKIAAALPRLEAHFDALDRALGESPYLAGERVSIADLFLLPQAFYLVEAVPDSRQPLERLRHFQAWYRRMAERPSFAATGIELARAA